MAVAWTHSSRLFDCTEEDKEKKLKQVYENSCLEKRIKRQILVFFLFNFFQFVQLPQQAAHLSASKTSWREL